MSKEHLDYLRRKTADEAELVADNARLREALHDQLNDCINFNGGQLTICIMEASTEALAATPEQSLARIRNQVREECAAVLDDDDADLYDLEFHAAAIRAMKEPE